MQSPDAVLHKNFKLTIEKKPGGIAIAHIYGNLNFETVTYFINRFKNLFNEGPPENLILDCRGIDYCDTIGSSIFIKILQLSRESGNSLEIINLDKKFSQLLDLFHVDNNGTDQQVEHENLIEKIGHSSIVIVNDLKESITFIGQAIVSLLISLLNPRRIRWKDVFITSEKVGVNAIGIIALVNFLVGLVIAFQSAIPLQQYGGAIFVADLVVLSVFRELGPLMTAIVVNGRSSSAFAAEIGTMKVNEEIDALTTMGLDPIRFLVVPKILASLVMIPILTIFGNLFGLLGGLVVMLALDFPPIAYLNEIVLVSTYVDILGGLFKSLFFAVTIAGIGCLEGLKTKKGPAAVGDSTTSSVVRGIILIIILDGIFGVLYFYLGI